MGQSLRGKASRLLIGMCAGSVAVVLAYTVYAFSRPAELDGIPVRMASRAFTVWLPISACAAAGAMSWVLWPSGWSWRARAVVTVLAGSFAAGAGFFLFSTAMGSGPVGLNWRLLGLGHGLCIALGYLAFVSLHEKKMPAIPAAGAAMGCEALLLLGLTAILKSFPATALCYSSSVASPFWRYYKSLGFAMPLLLGMIAAELWTARRHA